MEFSYKCINCGREYQISPDLYTCPECRKNQRSDEPLIGVLEVQLHGSWNAAKDSMYDLLPVEQKYFPPVPWGNTALWNPERLQDELNLPNLLLRMTAAILQGHSRIEHRLLFQPLPQKQY